MSLCRNLDVYFDVIFQVSEHPKGPPSYVKGNSRILAQRCDYFRALFTNNEVIMRGNQQRLLTKRQRGTMDKVRVYSFEGIPKRHFNAVLQYLYSDAFFISEHSLSNFCELLRWADYFLIERLKALAAFYAQQHLSLSNVLETLDMARRYNSQELEQYCLRFVATYPRDDICQIEIHQLRQLTCHEKFGPRL